MAKQKAITHYTDGYGGNYNYKTYCGKEIHSHSEEEGATVNPEKVDCKYCMRNTKFIIDLADKKATDGKVKYRIYLESDILSSDELRNAQREVSAICKAKGVRFVRRVFSDVIDHSWHKLDETWEAVKRADEVYSDTSLMPLVGGNYMGAPVIFNEMCKRAAKEGLTGKELYILRQLKDINWYMIDLDAFDAAFKTNFLYMLNDEYEPEQVDVDTLLKDLRKNKRR